MLSSILSATKAMQEVRNNYFKEITFLCMEGGMEMDRQQIKVTEEEGRKEGRKGERERKRGSETESP